MRNNLLFGGGISSDSGLHLFFWLQDDVLLIESVLPVENSKRVRFSIFRTSLQVSSFLTSVHQVEARSATAGDAKRNAR